MSTHRRIPTEDAGPEALYSDLYRAWRAAHRAAAQAEERALQAAFEGPAAGEELARARALRRRADEVLLHASHAGARLMEAGAGPAGQAQRERSLREPRDLAL